MSRLEQLAVAGYCLIAVVVAFIDLAHVVWFVGAWLIVLSAPMALGWIVGRSWAALVALVWVPLGLLAHSDDAPAWLGFTLVLMPLSAALILGGVFIRGRIGG